MNFPSSFVSLGSSAVRLLDGNTVVNVVVMQTEARAETGCMRIERTGHPSEGSTPSRTF